MVREVRQAHSHAFNDLLRLAEKGRNGTDIEYAHFEEMLQRVGWTGDPAALWGDLISYCRCPTLSDHEDESEKLQTAIAAAPADFTLTRSDVVAMYASPAFDDDVAIASQEILVGGVLKDIYEQRRIEGVGRNTFVRRVLGCPSKLGGHQHNGRPTHRSNLAGMSAEMFDPDLYSAKEFCEALMEGAERSTAVQHPYLEHLTTGNLPNMLLAISDFAIQYEAYNGSFYAMASNVLEKLSNEKHRNDLQCDLDEEAGRVDESKVSALAAVGIPSEWYVGLPHSQIFKRFSQAARDRLPAEDRERLCPCKDDHDSQYRADTNGKYVEGIKQPGEAFAHDMVDLVKSAPEAGAAGILAFAVEGIVHSIYSQIIDALEKHSSITPQEYCFFPLHVEVDDDHAATLDAIAQDLAVDAESRRIMSHFVGRALHLRATLWDGLLDRAQSFPKAPCLATQSPLSSQEANDGADSAASVAVSGSDANHKSCALHRATQCLPPIKEVEVEHQHGGQAAQDGSSTSHAATTSKVYDAAAANWSRKHPTCLSDFTGRRPIFDLCKAAISANSGKTHVLDLGCGEGYVARKLRDMGAAQVVGIDVSREMIGRAREAEANQPSSGLHFYVGDVSQAEAIIHQRLPELALVSSSSTFGVAKETFELIVCVFCFNYVTIDTMRATMQQAFNMLKPGGTFIFSVPHPSFQFWDRPREPPFFFDRNADKGYFSGRDVPSEGFIYTLEGKALPVRCMHKTWADYFDALAAAGFTSTPQVHELTVTDDLASQGDFFAPLHEVPLHVAFQIQKNITGASLTRGAPFASPTLHWAACMDEKDFTVRIPAKGMKELADAAQLGRRLGITAETYHPGKLGSLPCIETLGQTLSRRVFRELGAVVLQLDLEALGCGSKGPCNTAEKEALMKLAYSILCHSVGHVRGDRGKFFDVKDRNLDVRQDNVLFSASSQECSFHTDSTNKDVFPDAIALLCVRPAAQGGESLATNAVNAYYALKNRLPPCVMHELERPLVRDLIGTGFGSESDTFKMLARTNAVMVNRIRANRFPVFSRVMTDGIERFTFRYMRQWIESGHRRAGYKLSPLLKVGMDILDQELQAHCKLQCKLGAGDIFICNNHVIGHARSAFMEDNEQQQQQQQHKQEYASQAEESGVLTGRLLVRSWMMYDDKTA